MHIIFRNLPCKALHSLITTDITSQTYFNRQPLDSVLQIVAERGKFCSVQVLRGGVSSASFQYVCQSSLTILGCASECYVVEC